MHFSIWILSPRSEMESVIKGLLFDVQEKALLKLDFSIFRSENIQVANNDFERFQRQVPLHYDDIDNVLVISEFYADDFITKLGANCPGIHIIFVGLNADSYEKLPRSVKGSYLSWDDFELKLKPILLEKITGIISNEAPKGVMRLTVNNRGLAWEIEGGRKGQPQPPLHDFIPKIPQSLDVIERRARSLQRYADASNDVVNEEKFLEEVQNLGETIWLLFFEDEKFRKAFDGIMVALAGEGSSKAKEQLRNLRIIIELSEDRFELPAELLFSSDDNTFVTIYSPTSRYIEGQVGKALLENGKDDEKNLRALIIQAGNSKGLPEGDRFWPALAEASEESLDIRGLLESSELVSEVMVRSEAGALNGDYGDRSLKSEIIALLHASYFDIVHYIGHCDPNGKSPGGLPDFIFPNGGEAERLDATRFAKLLCDAEVGFLFLNCCHSASKGSVMTLAQGGVPAVLGFQWDIEDNYARKFAKIFYEKLLGRNGEELGCFDVPIAFFEARKKTWLEGEERVRIWAAPMLVWPRRT